MHTESATDMLGWTDKQMETNMGLKTAIEDDGEPSPETILEPAEPVKPADQLQTKPQEGKLAKPAAAPTAPAAPAAEAPPATEEGKEPETPEPERPKPIVEFKVYDKEGQLDIPPDITVTYDANGRTRENVPLDRVVRLAQMGEYNAEREQQVAQFKEREPQLVNDIRQRDSQLQQWDAWFEQILSDENFRQRAVENYATENTAEIKLQRAQDELRQRDTRERENAEAQDAAAFVQTQVTPRVTQLMEQNTLVPFEEVMGRFNMIIAPYMVRGRVAYQHLPTVKHLVDTELSHWVHQQQSQRDLDKKRVTDTVAAAQTKTTLAKRQLARAQQPTPSAQASAPAVKSTEFESAEEWFERTLPVTATP